MSSTPFLIDTAAWKALQTHHREIGELHLRRLFSDDPQRGARLTVEAAGIFLDFSKNRLTHETIALLVQLAEQRGLRDALTPCSAGRKSI